MYRLGKTGNIALALVAVLVLGYAFVNFFSPGSASVTSSSKVDPVTQLSQRVSALENQVQGLQSEVSSLESKSGNKQKGNSNGSQDNGQSSSAQASSSQSSQSGSGQSAVATVTGAQYLNVRQAPSASALRTGVLQQGQKVTILSQQSGWDKVRYHTSKSQTATGWVSQDYLQTSGN